MKLDLSPLCATDRALVAHAVGGLSFQGIAARAEMTEGRVRHRLFNAMQLLKDLGQNTDDLERTLKSRGA